MSSSDWQRWSLPGATALAGQGQPGSWLLELEQGWALVGTPPRTARRLRQTGYAAAIRLVLLLDAHQYHSAGLGEVLELTAAPAYALPDTSAVLAGRAPGPEAAEDASSPLLWPVGRLFALLGGQPDAVTGVRPLRPGSIVPEAPGLRVFQLEGLAPGAAALLDEARGYLLLGAAASQSSRGLQLAPRREVRDPEALRRSLSALLARPLQAVLLQLGPPLVGDQAIERLRALVQQA